MLRPMKSSEFDAVFSLLRSSFPPDERRPEQAQRALLAHPKYTMYVTDDLSAVITLWQFSDFSFIEHFAVDPRHRNHGLGAAVLQSLLSSLSSPVVLEAELPETELAVRRLAFYQRNGFHINPYEYIQPPYSSDRSAVPLLILSTGNPLTQSQFELIRKTLYKEVYKV